MLTVIVASYNGAGTLPEVLRAYDRLEPPAGGWRLVLVDNGSSDATAELARSFHDRLPLVLVSEPRRGQNTARNAGLSHVHGDLVVFTDDDVLPDPRWLVSLRTAADAQPGCAVFGGPILPRWERQPEQWILDVVPLSITFAIRMPTNEGVTQARSMFSPNMAVRAELFRNGLRFDESIGPRGNDYAMGSETELLRRLDRAGLRAWHCPDAVVYHMIRAFQLRKESILQRAFRFGRGQYRLEWQGAESGPTMILGWPRYLVWRLALEGLRVFATCVDPRRVRAFPARWRFNYLLGQMYEARRMQSTKPLLHPHFTGAVR